MPFYLCCLDAYLGVLSIFNFKRDKNQWRLDETEEASLEGDFSGALKGGRIFNGRRQEAFTMNVENAPGEGQVVGH